MQIEYSIEGGLAYFPGLAKPTVFDMDDLPPETAEELKHLIDVADFFNLPAHIGSIPEGAADMRSHLISISDAGRSQTVKLAEPVRDAHLHELLGALQKSIRSIKSKK